MIERSFVLFVSILLLLLCCGDDWINISLFKNRFGSSDAKRDELEQLRHAELREVFKLSDFFSE